MGATNHTTNYNLSQFVGTDKPAWLQDYNGDMSKIDVGINAAKVAADSAGLAAGNAQSDATTANNAITNTITPAITALQTTVGNQGGAINTINSLIGNGTPTTTDQTIIGAINELNAGKVSNDRGSIEVIGDGVKTFSECLDELKALIDYDKVSPSTTIITMLNSDFRIQRITDTGSIRLDATNWNDTTQFMAETIQIYGSSTPAVLLRAIIPNNGTLTITDLSNNVLASGNKITLYY